MGADGRERRPVVAVRELLGAARRRSPSASVDVRAHLRLDRRLAAVVQRVAVHLPVDVGIEEVDERRQHVDVLGAVVVDRAVDLTGRLDEQRDPVHLLAVGVGDLHPPDVRCRQVGAVVGRHDERRVLPVRQRAQVVDELADERVGGADLHAVQLVLHAGGEVVAGCVGLA